MSSPVRSLVYDTDHEWAEVVGPHRLGSTLIASGEGAAPPVQGHAEFNDENVAPPVPPYIIPIGNLWVFRLWWLRILEVSHCDLCQRNISLTIFHLKV